MRTPLLAALAVAMGCTHADTLPPRPQLVLVVDTDAHVSGELAAATDVSADATVDTLRVDLLDGSGATDSFIVSDVAAWPVSFGLVPGAAGAVSVRLRLFRALFASPGTLDGVAVLDPPPEVTIDRTVALQFPAAGVSHQLVVLTEDCMGTPPSFLAPATTCVDATDPAADPSTGVEDIGDATPPTQVSSWAPGVDVPCAAQPGQDQICVPGGFDIMGDATAVGYGAVIDDPLPYRPTIVSPFLMDVHEMTVGRFRQLAVSGKYAGTMPTTQTPSDSSLQFCTWLGPDDATNDSLPLNCIDQASAEAVCKLLGGALPSEAQWNHEARGRGQRRSFPWGESAPTCCTASYGRNSGAGSCNGMGLEPVGSHPPAACGGVGDVSRDGAVDLGGSVTEALVDDFERYDGACWSGVAIPRDPVCTSPDAIGSASRGGDWEEGPGLLITPLRLEYAVHPAYGFRCVHPGGAR
jgi:formylglycine-generating enzyme required for sulfatase activity